MNEIGIQDLIYQVKNELLTINRREILRDPDPLFVIDKIELEISVNVSQSKEGGIKITVLSFAEASSKQSREFSHGHVVKVSLSSLLPREELLRDMLSDPENQEKILNNSSQAFVKGTDDPDFRR